MEIKDETPTIRQQVEATTWPRWLKDLFITRCNKFAVDQPWHDFLTACFIWSDTEEGNAFWESILEYKLIPRQPVNTKEGIIAKLQSLTPYELESIIVEAARLLKIRGTREADLENLQKNFDQLLEEKKMLQKAVAVYDKQIGQAQNMLSCKTLSDLIYDT